MNQEALQKRVEEISLTYFNRPFLHQAVFNNRLRTTGGRYHLNTHNLDFNPKVFEAYGEDILDGIIKHELCHYHLHIEGKGYRHADADFKNLLYKVGGLRYTPSLEMKQETILRWEYKCKDCQSKLIRKRRFNPRKFVCGQCHGRFKLLGRKELEINKV